MPPPRKYYYYYYYYYYSPAVSDNRRPRSVFSTHSDTQAVPAFHCIRMFKGIFFDTRVFKTNRQAV